MPDKKPMDLLKDLKDIFSNPSFEKLERTYLIYGDNGFIRERATQRLKAIMTSLKGGIERVIFDKNSDFNGWLSSLYDVPMFSSQRLIIASEVSSLKDEDVEALIEYVKSPSQDVVLLLLSDKMNTKKKIIKELIAKTASSKDEIDEKKNDLAQMIKGLAAERSKAIDNDAVTFLKMKFGSELLTIEQEIEKASIYVGNNKSISGRDVEFLSTGVASCSIFDLPPIFASKNKKRMFEVIYKLLEAGEHPVLINKIVTSRVQKLLLTFDLLDSGASDAELASKTITPPYYVRDLKTETKKYKREELANMYKRCMYIDSELKSAKREDFDILISGALKLMERI